VRLLDEFIWDDELEIALLEDNGTEELDVT
jgi:hypothetical protein